MPRCIGDPSHNSTPMIERTDPATSRSAMYPAARLAAKSADSSVSIAFQATPRTLHTSDAETIKYLNADCIVDSGAVESCGGRSAQLNRSARRSRNA